MESELIKEATSSCDIRRVDDKSWEFYDDSGLVVGPLNYFEAMARRNFNRCTAYLSLINAEGAFGTRCLAYAQEMNWKKAIKQAIGE